MPGNIVGEAYVAIRPDLSGFAADLTSKLRTALQTAQAYADSKPIKFRIEFDLRGLAGKVIAARDTAQAYADRKAVKFGVDISSTGSFAKVAAARSTAQGYADRKPITFAVGLDLRELLAQLAVIRAISSLAVPAAVAGAAGGGGGGFATGAAAAAAADNKGNKGALAGLLTTATLTKLLGFGPGGGTGTNIPFTGIALAGAFSALSFAGLGLEHVLATVIGLAASLAGAIGGGLLLALGAAGVAAVGMGSDMLVLNSTLADSKLLVQGYNSLAKAVTVYGQQSAAAKAAQGDLNFTLQSLGATPKQGAVLAQSYSNLANAVALYGDNSKQAAVAQAALTKQINAFGLQGVQAELQLQQAAAALNTFWDRATQQARVAAVHFLEPFMAIAYTYIPLIAQAATTNFGIMTVAFKPLIAYIDGPAKAVFKELEAIFAKNLPTAVDALTQFVEILIKTIGYLAPSTGGFTKAIDDFFKKANSPSGFATWEHWMNILIGLFHTWFDFFKILAEDIVDFFKLTAGLGSSIIQALTGMLEKLHEWLNLTTTKTSLHNLFELHKQEVLELLQLLPPLLGALGHIYITVAPLLTLALTKVLDVLVPILAAITSNAWGAWLVGITLILAKLGLLGTALGLIKGGLTGIAKVAFPTTSSSGPLGIPLGVQKVWVVNMPVGGLGGGTPGLPALAAPAALNGLTGVAGLAEIAAPVAVAVLGLLGGIWILNAISQHQTSPVVPGPGTGGTPTGPGSNVTRLQNAYAATWQALLDSNNAVYKSSGLFRKNLDADLLAAGIPLSQIPGTAALIEKDFADGKIKTQAQLAFVIQQLTKTGTALVATTAATENIHYSSAATATIFYDFKGKLFGYLRDVTNQLLFQGLNTKQATIGTSEIATLWKDHKIKTQAQLDLAVKNYIAMTIASGGIPPTLNQLEGVLAGTDGPIKKFASKVGLLPGAAQNFLNGLAAAAGLMPEIIKLLASGSVTAAGELAKVRQWALTGTGPHAMGGFIPPGMWGTKSEDEIVIGGRSGATVLTASQSARAVGMTQINNFYGVGKETADLMDERIKVNNVQLIRLMAAGRRG